MRASKVIKLFSAMSLTCLASCSYWSATTEMMGDAEITTAQEVIEPSQSSVSNVPNAAIQSVETMAPDASTEKTTPAPAPVIEPVTAPVTAPAIQKKDEVKISFPKAIEKPAIEKPAIEKLPAEMAPTLIPKATVAVIAEPKTVATAVASATIKGKVTLLDKDGKSLVANEVIITVEPLSNEAKMALAKKNVSKKHNVLMKDKRYSPSSMLVKVGDDVAFKNDDAIKHNVFSSSGKNTFDLGTYGLGGNKSAKLVAPGIVKVYCNIHIEMVTFVAVSEWDTSFITKSDGNYEISGLPAGEYSLKVWHVRGETSKRLSIKPNETLIKNISLNTASYQDVPHLNKKGESYKIKPALFQDEFY